MTTKFVVVNTVEEMKALIDSITSDPKKPAPPDPELDEPDDDEFDESDYEEEDDDEEAA